jgi:hypothetical protein
MNAALREYIGQRAQGLENTLRVVIREELGRYEVKRSPVVRARSKEQAKRAAPARRCGG